MLPGWEFYALATPVVLLVGMSKGGFGGGLGLLAVPALSLMVDPRVAAGILLPILCTMDLVSLWSFRGSWDKANLKLMFPWAMLGLLGGMLTFRYMSADTIRFVIGVMALYFVGHYLWSKYFLQRLHSQERSAWRGGFWSGVSGYVSYIAHAGGARPLPFTCCRSICPKPCLWALRYCSSGSSTTPNCCPTPGSGS